MVLANSCYFLPSSFLPFFFLSFFWIITILMGKKWSSVKVSYIQFSSVQSLSRVRLFVTPWIAARQASLSITSSWSSPKLLSIKSVMPSSHLILCHPSTPALSTLSHASNLDRWSASHMIIYTFQRYPLKSPHPHLLPQSPKDCSLHLCLFCCFAYRVIVTIFLNSIYMH